MKVQIEGDLRNALAAFSDRFAGIATDQPLTSLECRQIIEDLLMERYRQATSSGFPNSSLVRSAYYLVRPILGVSIRRLFQKLFLRDWRSRSFPAWPVDRTVDSLNELLLIAAMKFLGVDRIPFIWFWPNGHNAAVSLTHDVESKAGLDHLAELLDCDASYGFRSAFQLIPEERYHVTEAQLGFIRGKGFEINVHDLNHDGLLFQTREGFLNRAAKINSYGRKFGARGFRAGALYRKQDWFEALEFQYEMSVPNVAHLEPQRGGCCTLFPFFIGNILELPVTMAQDYSLFNILGDYSNSVWHQQLAIISSCHGMAQLITHPDYLLEQKARSSYEALLAHIKERSVTEKLWITVPGQVNDWWRQRSRMELQLNSGRWEISGEGSSRASIAHAEIVDNRLRYVVERSETREAHPVVPSRRS